MPKVEKSFQRTLKQVAWTRKCPGWLCEYTEQVAKVYPLYRTDWKPKQSLAKWILRCKNPSIKARTTLCQQLPPDYQEKVKNFYKCVQTHEKWRSINTGYCLLVLFRFNQQSSCCVKRHCSGRICPGTDIYSFSTTSFWKCSKFLIFQHRYLQLIAQCGLYIFFFTFFKK